MQIHSQDTPLSPVNTTYKNNLGRYFIVYKSSKDKLLYPIEACRFSNIRGGEIFSKI